MITFRDTLSQLHDYSERSLRGLATCATRNICFYCAAPQSHRQVLEDAMYEHLCFNIANRAVLRAELRRRAQLQKRAS